MYLVALRLGNTTQLSFPSFPDTEIALRLGPTIIRRRSWWLDDWTELVRKWLIWRFCAAHPDFPVKPPGARFVWWTCNSLAAITLRVWFIRRTLCWTLFRWSLPPGVLVVPVPSSSGKVCAREDHVIIPATPNPQGHQRLSPPPLFLVVFARQLCRSLTIPSHPLRIYISPVPALTICNDRQPPNPFVLAISLAAPSHFTSAIVHNIRTDPTFTITILLLYTKSCSQNNPICCIYR